MNLNSLLAREFNYLQSSAGLTLSVQFMVRLHAFGPVHIETTITALRNESARVRGIKRTAKPLYNMLAEPQFKGKKYK